MNSLKSAYKEGFFDGIPIGLGYFSISFGFGITAVSLGIKALFALLISASNLTSAGQVAGISIIAASGTLFEMALTQFIINVRYSLMGIALSQRLEKNFSLLHRFIVSFFITDEIFALSASKKKLLCPAYMYGLATLPYIGWSAGTICGALAGNVLPAAVTAALGIAIYGMFVAIVVPPSKKDRGVLFAVIIAATLNCAIKYIPVFKFITPGFAIIICAAAAAATAAALRPIGDEADE